MPGDLQLGKAIGGVANGLVAPPPTRLTTD